MAKKNDQYWQDRNQDKLKSIEEVTDEDIKELTQIIDHAYRDLNDQIKDIYLKYAKDNEMSYWTAKQYLTQDERKEFQKDLKYYIEKSRDSEYAKAHKKELHSLSVRARVSRIEEVQGRIKMFAGGLHDHLSGKSKARLADIFSDSYYRTKHAVEGSDINKDFAMPGIKDAEEVLKTPWSGKDYSENVWDVTNNFEKKLKSTLNRGLIQGKHPDEIAREWRKQLHGKKGDGGTVFECRRLIETEATNISEQATLKYYKENKIEKYKYSTSGLSNVCDICIDLDEKPFDVDKAVAGVNYPPMHPFCHCTTVPVTIFDDEDESQYDLPYEQWYNQEILPLLNSKQLKESHKDDGLDIPSFAKKHNDNNLTPQFRYSETKQKSMDIIIDDLKKATKKTGFEYLALVDYETGENKYGLYTDEDSGAVGFSNKMSIDILLSKKERFTCIHTHPKSTSFSLSDLSLYLKQQSVAEMCVVGVKGNEYYLYIPAEHKKFWSKKGNYMTLTSRMKQIQKTYQKEGFTFEESIDMMWEDIAKEEGWSYAKR